MKKQKLALLLIIVPFLLMAQEEELTPMQKLEQQVEVLNEKADKQSALKITGYIQPQWQSGQPAATLKVGKGNTGTDSYSRIGIRRARLKFEYNDGGLASGVIQFNVAEKEGIKAATVQLKEAYLQVKDPFVKNNLLIAGVVVRPFGHETQYSSSTLESTERARVITTLFPDEHDLGAMLVLKPALSSPLNFIRFEGGLFAGNAINPETDNRLDFIGHLVATKPLGDWAKWGLGVSYYNGGVYQTNSSVYAMSGDAFSENKDAANTGAFASRIYYGVDAQFSMESPVGMTQLRFESVFGTQPGNKSTVGSPNRSALPAAEDTYIRPVSGWYAILVQDLGNIPVSAVVKYDVFDANTSVAGDKIGVSGSFTSSTDLKYSTWSLGALWRINPALRLTASYDLIKNETSSLLTNTDVMKDYSRDIQDNMLTVRLQYKF